MNTRSSFSGKIAAYPYFLWMVLFIAFPMLLVAYFAFTDSTGNFTFNNLSGLSMYTSTFVRSIWFAIVATFFCLVIAYPIAYIISQSAAHTQRTLILIIMLPMWMNFLLRTYSWMVILEDTGIINTMLAKIGVGPLHLINTPGAVILGMVYNYLPYMILPLYSVMSRLDQNIIEAAKDLGGDNLTVLKKVIFPLSLPGVVSGITMVFVPSVSTFYISQKLGGGKYTLIGDVIEMQFQTSYNYNLGGAISFVLMIIILISIAFMNRFADKDDGGIIV